MKFLMKAFQFIIANSTKKKKKTENLYNKIFDWATPKIILIEYRP